MDLKETENAYNNIIDLVTKEISNIDQIRSSEAIDFLKQTWTEKLRASGVFTPNQRNPEHFYNYSMNQQYQISRQQLGSFPMTTIIKPGPTMHYQNNPLSKQLYMYHKPTIKEEPDFSTEYKLRGIGPLVDNNNVNQKEKEKEAKEKETKEKEKLLEKEIDKKTNNNNNKNNPPISNSPYGGDRKFFPQGIEKKTEKIQIDIKKESFQSQKKAPEDLDDDDAQLFKEDPQPIQKKNGSEEDEEEKKENISQNQEGSNSHNSEGAELNSDDDISEKSNYETKNTLYCYYEKVSRTGEKWKVSLKDVIASIEDKEYLFGSVQGELLFNTKKKY